MNKQLALSGIGAKPTTSPPDCTKTAPPPVEAALPCLHDVLFQGGAYRVMASEPNRRIIWLLCLSNNDCSLCYKRLTPLFSQEDQRNAQIRKKSKKS